jgi:SecD/SecF fusion protein
VRAYWGRLAFIVISVGLLGLAWGLKGTELGQDLAGGAELRYGVTRRIVDRLRTLQMLRQEINDETKVAAKQARMEEIDRLLVGSSGAQADRLKYERSELELALDKDRLNEAIAELKRQEQAVGAGAEIIRQRLNGTSMEDVEVRTLGTSRLMIRLPYGKQAGETEEQATARFNKKLEDVQRLVEQQGVLNFHLAISEQDYATEYEAAKKRAETGQPQAARNYYVLPAETYGKTAETLEKHGIKDPLSVGYLPWTEAGEGSSARKQREQSPLLLQREIVLDGTIIDRAYPRVGDKGWYEIGLDLTASGAGKFERVSGKNVGRQLAIVLDDRCYSAPTIQNRISGGRAVITGQFTQGTATDLARVLTAGSLPVQIEFESKRIIGPSLGRDSINAGALAFVVGTGAIVLFMLVYYLSGGVIAVIGLALNLIIVMGALAAFNAKLTLPGIAGMLLTVGMAVDANVLIFERIREEKARGRTLRLAIQAGFDRAFVTIIDSNLTTILTALILYWFGSGPMKGFAVTLIIGITASMFTALYVARTLIEMLVTLNIISSMTMLKAIGETKIAFMRLRPFAYVLSLILLVGAVYAFSAHPDKYGIDFAGGTMLQVGLDTSLPDDQMRGHADRALLKMRQIEIARAAEQGRSPVDFGDARVQAIVGHEDSGGAMGFLLMLHMDAYQLREYKELLSKEVGDALSDTAPFPFEETVGQTVSQELGADAIRSVIFAVIVVFLYILFRFEFNAAFGVGAVVAIVHDVTITVGALAAADWLGIVPAKFDLTSVAAILTILGYSLNDTIVVFDRIREVRVQGKERPMRDVVDGAINTVLSRTVVTSITTLFAAVALMTLGGDTTKGFALAMIVGIIVGTYSSVFVASPIVVAWERLRHQPRLKKPLAIVAACVVVLALAGFVWQMIRTENERVLEEQDKAKIEDVWAGLNAYAMKHDSAYPVELGALVPAYVRESKSLAGAGAETGIGYGYVSGLRQDDSADCVLLYTPGDRLAYGGFVIFVDGRVAWMDDRRIEAALRSTLNKFTTGDRKVRNIEASRTGGPAQLQAPGAGAAPAISEVK